MPNTFITYALQPGVTLHVLPTEKFKTVRVRVGMQTPIWRETATANALVPLVLRRGARRFPTLRDMARHLEEHYGAGFDVDTRKIGESQIIEAHLHVASERFLPGAAGLLAGAVRFAADVLLQPLLAPGGGFLPEYVEGERTTLRQRIDGLVDDRMQYAVERCYAVMCADEPFGTYRYGQSADLEGISPVALYERYEALVGESPVHIVVVGAVDPEAVRDLFSRYMAFPRRTVVSVPEPVRVRPEQVRHVTETMDVQQGVLVMGCRLPVRYADEAYPALLMYNGVLGAFSHSKLFTEVRERASLAYTAFSRMETVKGVQILFAGIDVRQYEKARDIMLQQLEAIRVGKVSEAELEATRKSLVNGLRSSWDDASQITYSRLFSAVAGRLRDPEELIRQIEAVTLDPIVAVARGVELDTVYFLRDDPGKGE